MKKADFRSLIGSNDFRELFIMHLGWNNRQGGSGLMPINVDETDYQFKVVAQRNGLQVVVAEVDELPKNAAIRKIDNQLRPQSEYYISIYVSRKEPGHHLWVVPLKNVDKRDLVSVEYHDVEHTDFLFSKIGDIELGIDQETTIVDVKEAVHRAFHVNSEKLTKDFYRGFKKQHTAFAKLISGIPDKVDGKETGDRQHYASVMLNRLMFCYFIQKKGFLDLNHNYLRDKLDEHLGQQSGENFYSFYRSFLTELFSDGLNRPRRSHEFLKKFGQIPYLNGGMFDKHQIERDYADIDIADEAFENLFEFFDQWQWHLDTRHTASGRDINPDVLGYIFEQYINDRARMGAYYTKEDITEYIGRNTILPFIFDRISRSSKAMQALFAPDGWVWQTLRESGDRYLFDAVKQGWTPDWREKIPANIEIGIDTQAPNLLERRKDWNTRTPEPFALPTEIWRETIERLQRVDTIMAKISAGEITSVNDFITYNLDIRLFASDLIAKSESGSFIYNFYDALRSVTVLDPTCGSGAFLFAAMNILEPLYYECISRLDEFKDNPKVKAALDEITSKYRSNIHYFIYKSIILRNLYGVDLMAEATEIAKLRLFLKMVAVVDVDEHDENLGLDPLPDIDFNIRCGNTLVGYANEKEIEQDLDDHSGDMLRMMANDEFAKKIRGDMETIAGAYREFKRLQLVQEEHFAEFKQAKAELQSRLNTLNDTLSRRLFIATKGDPGELMFQPLFEEWLASHHPFHWVAEFYQIIHGNGGFDVIIGNPPYVEISKNEINYTLKANSGEYKDLYAYVLDRCLTISKNGDFLGFIIPISFNSTPGFANIFKAYKNDGKLFISTYADTAKIFIITKRLSIILKVKGEKSLFSTKYIRSLRPMAERLANAPYIELSESQSHNGIPAKFSFVIEKYILNKLLKQGSKPIGYFESKRGKFLHFTRAIRNYRPFYTYKIFHLNPDGSKKIPTELKSFCFSEESFIALSAFLNSTIPMLFFYWFTDVRNVNPGFVRQIPFGISLLNDDKLQSLVKKLMIDFETSKESRFNKNNGCTESYYYPVKSKSIIDEIDKVLAKHYGFTDEELDFIINYDIKYRMGDELNSGE